MDRREALAALLSLPATANVTVAKVKPSDVIVIESDGWLTDDAKERILASAKGIWPDNKVAVLDKGLRLKIASGTNNG